LIVEDIEFYSNDNSKEINLISFITSTNIQISNFQLNNIIVKPMELQNSIRFLQDSTNNITNFLVSSIIFKNALNINISNLKMQNLLNFNL
jgi:hypothetical protein